MAQAIIVLQIDRKMKVYMYMQLLKKLQNYGKIKT